jgi:hypothetical protein
LKRAAAVLALLCCATPAFGQTPPAAPSAAANAGTLDVPTVGAPCIERLPDGKKRPELKQSVPARGLSGHALTLTFDVVHGKGETVLPSGFQPQSSSKELEAMEKSGLYLPDPDGGAGPELERTEQGDQATTKIKVSFVPLPSNPGRNELLIPPLPIAIARASGDMMVLCTSPARVLIEDPTANVPDAKPKDNPDPRPQTEVWTTARDAALVALIALVVGALIAWLVGRWLRRPKPALPPPPPRPPWEVALEELFDLKHAGLLQEQRHAEYFDRVSDTVRKYMGSLYGFDGLESTTREALGVLRRVSPRIVILDTIESCLRDADLVKFARVTPSDADCALALSRAEEIVEATMPPKAAAPVPEPKAAAGGAA